MIAQEITIEIVKKRSKQSCLTYHDWRLPENMYYLPISYIEKWELGVKTYSDFFLHEVCKNLELNLIFILTFMCGYMEEKTRKIA